MVLSQTVQTIGAAGSVQMRIDICPDQTTEFQKFLVLLLSFRSLPENGGTNSQHVKGVRAVDHLHGVNPSAPVTMGPALMVGRLSPPESDS
ncbi:hypothetical protein L2089_04125 [Paenibacillus hunanensis]|nr:hypothetical protein [Paenibacillus hunanensis]